MSDILLEELLEKRDFYLYSIKHLEFRSLDDEDSEETEKLMKITIDELKKIEIEIRNIVRNSSTL